jgi:dTDP-4-dehydrorhamnose 3,5-epimerase
MQVETTPIPGLLVIKPNSFGDRRGFFLETYQQERYRAAGIDAPFVQDNQSRSLRGALRGLHYQRRRPQGKLVYVTRGRIWDVVVDIRRGSPAFGQWYGQELDDRRHHQVYAPPGVAHGFCVLSDEADFFYKCTDYYQPELEMAVRWDDPDLAIAWPMKDPVLSDKDLAAPLLKDIPLDYLPEF